MVGSILLAGLVHLACTEAKEYEKVQPRDVVKLVGIAQLSSRFGSTNPLSYTYDLYQIVLREYMTYHRRHSMSLQCVRATPQANQTVRVCESEQEDQGHDSTSTDWHRRQRARGRLLVSGNFLSLLS